MSTNNYNSSSETHCFFFDHFYQLKQFEHFHLKATGYSHNSAWLGYLEVRCWTIFATLKADQKVYPVADFATRRDAQIFLDACSLVAQEQKECLA